jgi:hypothetical protein
MKEAKLQFQKSIHWFSMMGKPSGGGEFIQAGKRDHLLRVDASAGPR